MLNFGIKYAQERKSYDAFLFISSHCIVQGDDSLYKMLQSLNLSKGFRSCFGRQVPAHFSSPVAIRDLLELYPPYKSENGSSLRLNNAFSMILSEALDDHSFDEDVTNIEDFLWSVLEIEKGFQIKYVEDSCVVHHHGPHHDDSVKRLSKTVKTLRENHKIVGYVPADIHVSKEKILAIYAFSNIDSMDSDFTYQHLKVWAKENNVTLSMVGDLVNDDPQCPVSLKEKLYSYLKSNNYFKGKYEYFIVFDTTFDISFDIPPLDLYLKVIKKKFPSVITPSVVSYEQLYLNSENGPVRVDAGEITKKENPGVYIGKRGNGWCIHISYLLSDEISNDAQIVCYSDNLWRLVNAV
jgi:hypothetical protein